MAGPLSNLVTQVLNSDSLLGMLGAPVCLLCGTSAPCEGLCRDCREALPRLPRERCPTCASPSPGSLKCGRCLAHPPALDWIGAAVAYTFPVDGLVQTLKYRHHLAAATVLGHLLADAVKDAPRPQVLIPVPLGAQRLRERGFNQSLEIARVVSRRLSLAVDADGFRRIRDTPPQASLAFEERAKNVRRAFVCDVELAGARVALVDDVITTGASLNECAKALRKAGASEVVGWVAARTLLEA
jgi:ComF family protein